ncbi:DUF5694 domain-containing protein [Zhouia amylolytica]|uniref:DUF5694 domain-containing protein n=1 Tax=Zhouia amylolytica TaxID=376730 RepID=UPI0020CEAC5B|nr:DUF5694 domain-containing protein [Zhouia amylolytica]MCQ0111708.1 hypothetical protein [Zhouia amylolytica]
MRLFSVFTLLFFTFFINNAQDRNTQILIVGTPHLHHIDGFDAAMVSPVITKLNTYNFDVVCIENMPAEMLYDIRSRKDNAFAGVINNFGGHRLILADSAQKILEINFVTAEKKISELRKTEILTDQDRLALIEYYIAAADITSAILQYNYLKDRSVLKQSRLSHDLIDKVLDLSKESNEIYSVAVPVAQHQHLEKIDYIDNFQDEALLLKHYPDFISDYQKNKDQLNGISEHPIYKKQQEILIKGIADKNLSAYYSFLNDKEYGSQDFQAQWAVWFKTNFESGSDKARFYLWEMRNLQITANIAKVCALNPGKRIMVIIGASHKTFLEKYLKQLPHVDLLSYN